MGSMPGAGGGLAASEQPLPLSLEPCNMHITHYQLSKANINKTCRLNNNYYFIAQHIKHLATYAKAMQDETMDAHDYNTVIIFKKPTNIFFFNICVC